MSAGAVFPKHDIHQHDRRGFFDCRHRSITHGSRSAKWPQKRHDADCSAAMYLSMASFTDQSCQHLSARQHAFPGNNTLMESIFWSSPSMHSSNNYIETSKDIRSCGCFDVIKDQEKNRTGEISLLQIKVPLGG